MIKRKFELDWGDMGTEIVEGENIAQAMTLAGYGRGAVRALKAWKLLPDPAVEAAARLSAAGPKLLAALEQIDALKEESGDINEILDRALEIAAVALAELRGDES